MKPLQIFNQLSRWFISLGYYYLAGTYRHIGNKYALTDLHESAIDLFGEAIKWNANCARAYLERGILYWREIDHPRRALHDLDIALTLDPTLSEVHLNRGAAHQLLHEYDAAITEFQTYLKVGDHPHWREYAASMIKELSEWVTQE